MSKYMTYAIVHEYIPLGEVEAPHIVAAIAKGEKIAEERQLSLGEVVAVPEEDESDA